jgi:hypothetical protein
MDLIAPRKRIENGACVRQLIIDPMPGPGTAGVLEPAIWISNFLPVNDILNRLLRRRRGASRSIRNR